MCTSPRRISMWCIVLQPGMKSVEETMLCHWNSDLDWNIKLGSQMNEIMYCCRFLLEHVSDFASVPLQPLYSSRGFPSTLYKSSKHGSCVSGFRFSVECLTSTTHETSPDLVGLNSIGSSSGDDTVHKWRFHVDLLLTATTLLTEQGGSFP